VEAGLLRDALTLLIGLVTGVLSAMFGVGGAFVSNPGVRALGAEPLVAVGTTLPSILPGAASGTVRYQREGLVDWQVVAWASVAGLAAVIGGSLLSHAVPGDGHLLLLAVAVLLGFNAWRTAFGAPSGDGEPPGGGNPAPAAAPPRVRGGWRPAVVGLAAGLLAGLLGVGGGAVMVPAFAELLHLPLKAAIATSLVCAGLFALPATVVHALLGDVDWRLAVLLTVGVVPGARLGASLTIRAAERRLRLAVGVFLAVVAAVYFVTEARNLLQEL
jgi:uncharacterized membrane protein YfcA